MAFVDTKALGLLRSFVFERVFLPGEAEHQSGSVRGQGKKWGQSPSLGSK